MLQTVMSLADGNVGEVWIGSQSRAAGYWSQPEKTAEDFGARLADAVEVQHYKTAPRQALLNSTRDFIVVESWAAALSWPPPSTVLVATTVVHTPWYRATHKAADRERLHGGTHEDNLLTKYMLTLLTASVC